jgi:hypothetical protein
MAVSSSSDPASGHFGVEQVGVVDDQDGGLVAFVAFSGEQVGGLADQGAAVEAGGDAEGAGDVLVDAARRWRDWRHRHGVAGGVGVGDGTSGGHGLAGASILANGVRRPG